MEKLRLLIISGSFPDLKCGVGIAIEKMVVSLRSMGAYVSLLTSCDPLVKKAEYVHALIRKWNIFSLFKIITFIKKECPDTINFHVPTIKYKAILSIASILPVLSKIVFKSTPFIVTVHDYSIARFLFKPFFLPLFVFSDIIIVTNDNDAKGIISSFPFLRERVKKLRMGSTVGRMDISLEKKLEFYQKISYKKSDRIIATLGFIKKERYIDLIIRVFHKLMKFDDDVKLIILGDVQKISDIKYKNYLLNLTKELGIKDKVYFTGFCSLEELSAYISISDLALLFYSRGASFRRTTIANFLVQKVPVITNINRSYGIDRELIDLDMIMIMDSLDMDAIYEKARVILYNENFRNKIKMKMENAQNIFDWRRNANELIDLCLSLKRREQSVYAQDTVD